jgi:hypothetical protein
MKYLELISYIFAILAEEREELEVLNNFRQKQLELKHRQLLQELESLKSARETTSLSSSSSPPNQASSDSNFKHLM